MKEELKRYSLIGLAICYSLAIGIITSNPVFSSSIYLNASDTSEHSIFSTVSANLIGQSSVNNQTPPLHQSSLFVIKKINSLHITTAPHPQQYFFPISEKAYFTYSHLLKIDFPVEDIGFPFHGFW
jgi:hypothetical protein